MSDQPDDSGTGNTIGGIPPVDATSGQAPQPGPPPAGWYADPSGHQRWWDGTQWGAFAPAQPPPQAGAPQFAQRAGYSTTPPIPPWGTWTHADGRPVDISRLPPYDPGKKTTAGILAILLGGLGIHKFLLGYTTEGVIMILLAFCGISPIIGLIEGIIYLTKSDSEFYWTYVADQKPWF